MDTPQIIYSDVAGPSTQATSPALPSTPVVASPRLTGSSSRLASLLRPGRSRSGSTASIDTVATAELDRDEGRSTPEQRRRTGRGEPLRYGLCAVRSLTTQPPRPCYPAMLGIRSLRRRSTGPCSPSRVLTNGPTLSPSYQDCSRYAMPCH
jgi:hypothetical protein